MSLALLLLSLLQIIIFASEITFPHKVQHLILTVKESPDSFTLDRFTLIYSLLPIIHIPFVILLFLSDVTRFFYYGLFFVLSFSLESFLIPHILKHRELVTFVATINLFITCDILRTLL